MFYFYRQAYLLYYLRKNFYISIFVKKNINIFFFLFWVYFFIQKILLLNNKYLLNYRYFLRNFNNSLNVNTNKFIYFFYLKCKNERLYIQRINNSFYFIFFFSRFLFYHFYLSLFFKKLFFLQKNYFLLKNYFFSKLTYRYNYFELFWTLFEIIPKHWFWKKRKKNKKSKIGKKWNLKRSRKWFSYLFRVSSSIETFFNIQKDNSFLILAKKSTLRKYRRKFKPCYFRIIRFKRQIKKNFFKKLKKGFIRRFRWRKFGWFFKLRRKKKYLRIPKRLKFLYLKNNPLKRIQFKYLKRKRYVRRRKYNLLKLFRIKFAKRSFKLLKKKKFVSKLELSLNFNILRKLLTFLSSSSLMQSITRVRTPYSLFSNFRLIFTIFSEGSFIKNLLYVNREKRYLILFNYLKSRFLKKNISKALYSFMFNSNVIYHFFIPKVCRNLLLKIYRRKRLFGFSWIFFLQLSNLFLNLFSSNLSFNLNFVDSERLNRSYLNNMFSKFLMFNPPRSKYQFLKELCDIYLLTGMTKDSNLLHQWIIKNLSIIFFRRHWQFLSFLKMTLLYVFKILESHFGIKGIFITFRGKIGQVGSVRKKVYFLQQGTHALSNLSLKASFNTSITKTDTGAIGVSVYLFY